MTLGSGSQPRLPVSQAIVRVVTRDPTVYPSCEMILPNCRLMDCSKHLSSRLGQGSDDGR